MLVKLWDTKTGKVLFTLDSHEGEENLFFYLQPINLNRVIKSTLLNGPNYFLSCLKSNPALKAYMGC